MLAWITIISLACAAMVYGSLYLAIPWLQAAALARPNDRSSHRRPTPQGAGVVLAPVALLGVLCGSFSYFSELAGGQLHLACLACAVLLLTCTGLFDDMRELSVTIRLAIQVVAAALIGFSVPPDLLRFSAGSILLAPVCITLALIAFTNFYNFMDGIDWISATETASLTAGVILLVFAGAVDSWLGFYAAALLGAAVGFAPWNAPPAKVFLGDAGSLPLGMLLGLLLVYVAAAGHPVAAAILPLYYLADAGLTLGRRLLRGERVWQPHREHFYQRAFRNSGSAIFVVARVGALNVVLIGLAVVSTCPDRIVTKLAVFAAALVLTGLFLYSIRYPRRDNNQGGPGPAGTIV